MASIDVLLIENNKKEADVLYNLLQNNFTEVNVKGVALTLNDAIIKVETLRPDLVFVNSNMTGKDGTAFFEKLDETNTDIIFTMVNDVNVLKTISRPALSYLTKPVNEKMLKETFSRFIEKNKWHAFTQSFSYSLEAASNDPHKFNKIVIPESRSYSFVKLSDILYLEADGNYSIIHLIKGKSILSTRTLKYFEQVLPEATFYRSHKSYLINLNLVKKLLRNDGLKVLMEKNIELDVADRNRRELLEKVMPDKKG